MNTSLVNGTSLNATAAAAAAGPGNASAPLLLPSPSPSPAPSSVIDLAATAFGGRDTGGAGHRCKPGALDCINTYKVDSQVFMR